MKEKARVKSAYRYFYTNEEPSPENKKKETRELKSALYAIIRQEKIYEIVEIEGL